jgi:hypothetical protein
MKANTLFTAPAQAGRPPSTIQAAFLAALRQRIDRGGHITIPTGTVNADELARVLAALDRAGERRR